jgi:DNA segregation ATPase FtsK/SpoIIIE-like protein
MPLILIVIDEVADLMIASVREAVEESVVRLSGKGDAASIHLVIATHR